MSDFFGGWSANSILDRLCHPNQSTTLGFPQLVPTEGTAPQISRYVHSLVSWWYDAGMTWHARFRYADSGLHGIIHREGRPHSVHRGGVQPASNEAFTVSSPPLLREHLFSRYTATVFSGSEARKKDLGQATVSFTCAWRFSGHTSAKRMMNAFVFSGPTRTQTAL
ncbi:3192_t:CDS:2 [Acaulospora colombiana]|uniref:3192_t:CDS:1 n=1 Tax=Acaulospora colombiana TaxID=27376 RepID=A0ACA9QB63_9GLOM|nr:3192_t:CDS:2 [Acaulospora colombiana]